jgi:hypothetical protein
METSDKNMGIEIVDISGVRYRCLCGYSQPCLTVNDFDTISFVACTNEISPPSNPNIAFVVQYRQVSRTQPQPRG